MARLGSATRGRRTAALRAIGATGPQLSRILAGEALVGAAGGLITGTLGFLAARQLSWIEVGGAGFFPADLTPAPASAVLIAALVPVLATGAALLRPQRPPGRDPAGTGGPSRAPARRRRVPTGWAYAAGVGALVAVQLGPAHPVFGADLPAALIILAGTALLGLLVVPVLLPPALAVATRLVPTRRPVWLLAARRLRSDNGAASRAVTAVSVVVAATVALLPVLAVVDHTIATGYHADQDPTRYRVQIDGASTAELALLTADLRSVPGVQAVAGGSYVWMTDAAMDDRGGSEVFIADCRHIAASMGITDCRSGDVLRVPAYGTGDVFRAGDELQPVGENTTPDSSWTVPDAGVRDVHPVDGAGGPGAHAGIWAPHLIVTPEALGASLDAVLAGSFAFFVVDTERADALDDIRNAAASFGSRAQVTSMTEWAADSGTVQVIATLQTGLALGGSILLLLAFTGLIVVAVEQFVDRRRPLTLAVAAGVPGSLIARSLIAESFVTGLVAAVVGTAVGLPLAAYAAGLSSLPVGLPWWGLVPVAATCILATVAATAATLPALAAVTRIEHLRTS